MLTETTRKLDVIVRMEEVLAELVHDTAERIEDPEVRDHLHQMSEHHTLHAAELINAGVLPEDSGRLDMEVDRYRSYLRQPQSQRQLVETLSNLEREQRARIDNALLESLEPRIVSALENAGSDINADVRMFRPYLPHEGPSPQSTRSQ